MDEIVKVQMRKRNMKLFSLYNIFFYTINFLFLTQVKNINPADVVLIDSFYYLFSIFAQIPATFIIEFLGKKNSIIFANILSCLYMLMIIFSKNLFYLVIAEILSSTSFAVKESAEPSLLSESIPPCTQKSRIFARINEKGIADYYIINAVSTVLAGILYEVNPYIPISISLCILIFVTFLSIFFIEPTENHTKNYVQSFTLIGDLKDAI